jgi:hypothetical protein
MKTGPMVALFGAEQLLALIEGKVSSVQKAIRPFLVERESHGPNGTPDV